MALLDRDHYEENLLDRVAALEERLQALERAAASGLFPTDATMELPGQLSLGELSTESLTVVDAGSAGVTEQDWVEVEVGGNTGYVRVFAAK